VLRPGGVLDEPVAGGDRGGDRQRQRPLLHGPRRPSDPAVGGRHRRPRSDRTGTSGTPAIAPLPEPIRRAINREPVAELEWPWLSTSATVTYRTAAQAHMPTLDEASRASAKSGASAGPSP
jgi:hypothetical protein